MVELPKIGAEDEIVCIPGIVDLERRLPAFTEACQPAVQVLSH